jgi:hypothetical protein
VELTALTLALKLVLTPILIAAASLAGRRFGPGVGGWLVGIPFTSGPVAFFLALERGEAFAAAAAVGILAGTASQAAHALAYAWIARRASWPLALAAATAAFLVVTVAFALVAPPLPLTLAIVLASLVVGVRLMPASTARVVAADTPRWDLPARMFLATVIVFAVTEAAPLLGPFATGLLSPYPIYATILAAFAHQQHGAEAAARVLRGLLFGLFAFASFFVVLALTLVPLGIATAFAIALLVTLAIEALSFRRAR